MILNSVELVCFHSLLVRLSQSANILFRVVMARALPKVLIEEVGFDTLLSRLPSAYSHSIFSSYVASRFVYRYGINSSPIEFHYFLQSLAEGEQQQ